MEYQNVKGTHDIILKEARAYQEIESCFISLAQLYGYHEYRTPIIEPTGLFSREQNDSSDMVRKQMYTFFDLAKRSISLRPEGTASIARSIVNNKLYAENDFPIKAYYLGPVFRYERPKAGTYRQFHQFGVENIGLDSPYMDVETVILSYRALRLLGFKNLKLKINTLGDNESRTNYQKALVKYFMPLIDKMCPDCQERLKLNPLRILDCKVVEDQAFIKKAPQINDYLNEASLARFNETKKILDEVGIPYEVDPHIVRGLDYYSHLVYEYEYVAKNGLNVGALGGGGHYDHLIHEVGGPMLAGVGFAFGLERIYSLLKEENLLPNLDDEFDFYVMPVGEVAIARAFLIADYLRALGYKADAIVEKKSFKAMFRKAEKKGARYSLIIGEDELKNNEVIIKDMESEIQTKVKNADLKAYCDELFAHHCHCHDHDEKHECHCHDHDKEHNYECKKHKGR